MTIKDSIIPTDSEKFLRESPSFRDDVWTDRVDEPDWRYQVERWCRSGDRQAMEECLMVFLKMSDQLDELDPDWRLKATRRFSAAAAIEEVVAIEEPVPEEPA